ncbi:MAG: hypothetical protein UX91_C0004G0014 [Candidatus Amesbacteria bacterium GW2011_GWB1_47_19]|nr:MAG: hypothetical protein UW51_C0005G0014 [Candidatus Amesbacteria bacterium GW2011_GWA1_44_24]KKU31571.1 MAG: hypothetical protein UX46_C0004G0014 [Candidatus Amesbacteria bacterium GW2011_GWC1_46_24]KKU67344.1 MAG: hypothetical protein UX91_C0004G0014 [Candidatus Amesbacteria bacterium GW2011_GWB1_47_19]OGD05241.1 MAG: hypothetical protein A2379_04510 [Candidatus Amesbacteria bacterium RIFOXYB1_FULL_47_13]HBC72606.1 hypothetical protein [Candidatus Amesbacteria bacterium]
MDIIGELIASLRQEKTLLERNVSRAKFTRDHAPSAMESHSDTTRSEFEKLVFALESQIREIDNRLKLLASVPQISDTGKIRIWSQVTLKNPSSVLKLILTPTDLGGRKIRDTLLVSENSQLGATLLGKSPGDKLTFNNQVYVIS